MVSGGKRLKKSSGRRSRGRPLKDVLFYLILCLVFIFFVLLFFKIFSAELVFVGDCKGCSSAIVEDEKMYTKKKLNSPSKKQAAWPKGNLKTKRVSPSKSSYDQSDRDYLNKLIKKQ